MMGAESKETATSTDMREDSRQCCQQHSGDEFRILSKQDSKTLESNPSTEKCTVAYDDAVKSAIPSQLKQKRLDLRNLRFSLEQRLYEFGTHYSINTNSYPTKPTLHVQESK